MQIIRGRVEKAKKVVLYGPEGIGKSSLSAQFPNPVFIDTEGSTTEMDVARMPKPTSWEMLKQQVQWVKQQGPSQIGTLVIDTIDWAEMLCTESVCAQHSKNGVEDFGYGKGYIYVSEEFGRFLNLLSDVVEAGIHVVLNAHAQIIKFEQPDEMGAYDRYQLKLGQKTGSKTAPLVKEWADMLLFINYKTFSVATEKDGKKNKAQGGSRTVYATHHPAWDAKNRQGLPDEFPLDYSYIAHIFAGAVSTQPATMQPAAVQVGGHQDSFHPPGGNHPPAIQQPPAEAAPQPPAHPVTPPPQPAPAADGTGAALDPNIPRSLRDLMVQYNVTETDIQIVVSQKGYYPMGTPITKYDPQFIEGVLVAAWPKVYGMIQEVNKQIPFQ